MKPLLTLDIETTGTSITEDAIVQIGLYSAFEVEREWLVKPWRTIPPEVDELTGITNEMVKGCPTFAEAALGIMEHLEGCDLLGFNLLNFDVPLLYEEFARCGIEWNLDGVEIIDAGNIFKRKEERTLSAAVKFYCHAEHKNAHSALADCTATERVFLMQLARYDDLRSLSRGELARYSRYDEERLSFDGKIVMRDGAAYFNFGKHKDKPVLENVDYAQWMIYGADFPAQTKAVLRKVLEKV